MTIWTELDQAYLEEWGHHPELSDADAKVILDQQRLALRESRLDQQEHVRLR